MCYFPKRTKQHKIDSDGVALVQYLLPDWYIFRKIDERDYGIDALLELVCGDEVMGKFISLQIKSKEEVNWNKNNSFIMKIKKSTVNYWFYNNMPVIILLVDIKNESAYFIDLKRYVRINFNRFIDDSLDFSFEFNSKLDITKNEIKQTMLYAILLELDRENFESYIVDFIKNYDTYKNHLEWHDADFFMIVEDEFLEMTKYICSVLRFIAQNIGIELDYIDFLAIRKESEKVYEHYYNDTFYEVIEWEITKIHLRVQKWFEKIVLELKKFIDKEQQYWKNKNWFIYDKLNEIKANGIFME